MADKQVLVHLCYIFLFVIFWSSNYIYKESMYDYSIELIIEIAKTRDDFQTWFFTILANLGSGQLYQWIMLLVVSWYGPVYGLYINMFFTICNYMLTITKLMIHDPRPYMTDERIDVVSCSHEYGSPSGHAVLAATYSTFLFLMYNHSQKQTHLTMSQRLRDWKYILGVICIVSYPLIMAYDRLFMGVHTIDQIIFGLQLGYWLAFYFHFCYKKAIQVHVHRLLASDPWLSNRFMIGKYALNVTVFFFVFAMGSQILAFSYTYYTFKTPQEWIDRLASKCSSPSLFNTFEYMSLYYTGGTAAGYGAYMGLLLRVKLFPGNLVRNRTLKNFTLRMIFIYILTWPFLWLDSQIPWDVSALWIIVVFKALIPGFFQGVMMFAFPDQIIHSLDKLFGWDKKSSEFNSEQFETEGGSSSPNNYNIQNHSFSYDLSIQHNQKKKEHAYEYTAHTQEQEEKLKPLLKESQL
eukprot:403345086